MQGWQKLFLRAGVVSGVATVSYLIKMGFPPDMDTCYYAGLSFVLGILVFIQTAFENDDLDGDGKPDHPKKKYESDIKTQLNETQKKLKRTLSCLPNLWFP